MLELEKPKTDEDRGIYFWCHRIASGKSYLVVTYSSHQTNFTPFWCDWCNWGSSVPCDRCCSGDWYPWPSGNPPRRHGDSGSAADGVSTPAEPNER